MAIVSRSNRRQPVFDPSEIEDLIFSPAVGSGVGSHLVGSPQVPAPQYPMQLPAGQGVLTTVDRSNAEIPIPPETPRDSGLDLGNEKESLGRPLNSGQTNMSTVDTNKQATVDISTTAANMSTDGILATVDISLEADNDLKDLSGSFESVSESRLSNTATVDKLNTATVAIPNMTTVVDVNERVVTPAPRNRSNRAESDLSTVATPQQISLAKESILGGRNSEPSIVTRSEYSSNLSTVVPANTPTVRASATRKYSDAQRKQSQITPLTRGDQGREPDDPGDAATVGISDLSTVESVKPVRQAFSPSALLWITEQGDLVPQARVKRIRLAQDVINATEESVYDTLWAAKAFNVNDREVFRIVQAGYDYLVKRTRLSKKTIQRIVAKLLDKDFISIERPADIYERTATVYRVFSYKSVLDLHAQKGRSHVAKIGPGFSYVHPMDDPRTATRHSFDSKSNLSTVAKTHPSTADSNHVPTRVESATETVAQSNVSTVVQEATSLIGKDTLVNHTSPSTALYQELAKYGTVDDDVIYRLIRSCKQQAPDCTEFEIIYFLKEKGSIVRARDSRIHSPIGFLLTAVPKCFTGEGFRLYREEEARRREVDTIHEAKRQAEIEEWHHEQEAQLMDPSVSEEDKRFIRRCLGIPLER